MAELSSGKEIVAALCSGKEIVAVAPTSKSPLLMKADSTKAR